MRFMEVSSLLEVYGVLWKRCGKEVGKRCIELYGVVRSCMNGVEDFRE